VANPGQENGDADPLGNACQPARIVTSSPAQNDIHVPATQTEIAMVFDVDLDPATVTAATLKVRGDYYGLYPGAVSYSAPTRTAFFTPSAGFLRGERITVLLTTGVSTLQYHVPFYTGYSWSFATAPKPGPALFMPYKGTSQIAEYCRSISAADLDDDNDIDVATVLGPMGYEDGLGGLHSRVFFGKNSGSGTFIEQGYQGTSGTDPFAVFAVDVNNDGHNDLVVANHEPNKVTVRQNNGSGGFLSQAHYDVGDLPTDIIAADLDGDGYADLITEDLYVLYNHGNGTFEPCLQLDGAGAKVTSGDVNGDGMIDLITVRPQDNEALVIINKGMGDFASPVYYAVGGGPKSVVAADVTGDGLPDLATANSGSNSVSILQNIGDGIFASHVDFPTGGNPIAICAADLDGDDDIDLATGNDDYLHTYDASVLWNAGSGSFAAPVDLAVGMSGPSGIAAADVTGDGHIDLAVATTCRNSYVECMWGSANIISVLPNLGDTRKEPYPKSYRNGTRTTGRYLTLMWTDYWFAEAHQAEITNGSTTYIPDEDLALPQWTTPYLSDGNWTWKAKSKIAGVWSGWCEPQTVEVYTYTPPPSCPVLFTYTGETYVQENPLLTASEKSNYTEIVTDYYRVNHAPTGQNGRVRFQLREMEDEVTTLQELSLITVDHSPSTRVAVSVDGKISLYEGATAPISAVDHTGVDRLAEVIAEDGIYFVSDEPGYLIVTFPHAVGDPTVIGTLSVPKYDCRSEEDENWTKTTGQGTGDGKVETKPYSFEILASDGSWIPSSILPFRQTPVQEYVAVDPELIGGQDHVTIRISWDRAYATDVLQNLAVSNETPMINSWNMAEQGLIKAQTTQAVSTQFTPESPLVLTRDDTFEFVFTPDGPVDNRHTRDYIIRAVGRYQPDYSVYPHLLPRETELYSNYPNPFNPATIISYTLAAESHVRLDVYNVLGQRVTTLVNETQPTGRHQVVWNGQDESGHDAASGIYFYRLKTTAYSETKKMMLLR